MPPDTSNLPETKRSSNLVGVDALSKSVRGALHVSNGSKEFHHGCHGFHGWRLPDPIRLPIRVIRAIRGFLPRRGQCNRETRQPREQEERCKTSHRMAAGTKSADGPCAPEGLGMVAGGASPREREPTHSPFAPWKGAGTRHLPSSAPLQRDVLMGGRVPGAHAARGPRLPSDVASRLMAPRAGRTAAGRRAWLDR